MAHSIADPAELARTVSRIVAAQPVTDIHTHLYPPEFGDQLLFGIDELLTYHYLIAETLRYQTINPDTFWSMTKTEKADLIWKTLFLEHTPISEACRGVVTTLKSFGLNLDQRQLTEYRAWSQRLTPESAVDLVFRTANVEDVVMTNDPFNVSEREVWLSNRVETVRNNARFHAALRIDPMLLEWSNTYQRLQDWGYDVKAVVQAEDARTLSEAKRFLVEWGRRMNALYMAVSLPPEFDYPADDERRILLDHCLIPACQELGIPFALMMGVRRQVNPLLRLAGDGEGQSHLQSLANLCARYPQQRFLTTVLARENQHELVVLGRKFPNLMVFGCWWFMNNPSLIRETTRMRFEMLGTSVIPQHSDARVLDQLVYKWNHARALVAEVLTEQYQLLISSGWTVDQQDIERDVRDLFHDNFWRFIKSPH